MSDTKPLPAQDVGSGALFADIVSVITTPTCWLQNYPFSREWDKELKRLIRVERFTNANQYTARIGGHEVWVANHPYASFTLREHGVRPSRITIMQAKRKLISDVLQANIQDEPTRRTNA